MATDTKGFVLTSCKDVFFVCERIQCAINRVILPLRNDEFFSGRNGSTYQACSLNLYPGSQAVRIVLKYEGTSYTLCVHFTCDVDNKAYGPRSLSLSMGASLDAPRFMKVALESLSMLGQLYFTENDSDGARPVLLDAEPTTFIQACAAGDILGSQFPLKDWQAMYRRGDFGKKSFDAVIGLTREEIEDILGADYEKSRRLVEAHVEKYKASESAEVSTAV